MSLRSNFTLVFAACLFFSCRNSSVESTNVVHIDISRHIVMNAGDFMKETKLLRLESLDESFFRQIQNVIPEEDAIYINDGYSIFIFDYEGNYLRKIEKIGRGPGEYLRIDDFKIIDSNTLAVLDATTRNVLLYTKEGFHLKNYELDFYTFSMGVLNDSTLVFDAGYLGNETKKFHVLDMNTGEIVSSFFDFPVVKQDYLHYQREVYNFTLIDNTLFFTEMMNPRIYEISGTDAVEKYYLKIGDKTPNDKFFEKSYTDIIDFHNTLKTKGYLCAGGYFSQGQTFLLFRYSDGKEFGWHCLYNQESGESYLFSKMTVPELGELEIEPLNIIPYNNGKLTVVIPSTLIKGEEENNPYLYIGNLK